MQLQFCINIYLLISICSYSIPVSASKRYTSPAEYVELGKYPWILHQTNNYNILNCSAVLISQSHALVSAHCVFRQNRRCIRLFFSNSIHPFSVGVSRIAIHPDYTNHDYFKSGKFPEHDIAILELETSVNVTPVAIDTRRYNCTDIHGIQNPLTAGYAHNLYLKETFLEWLPGYGCGSSDFPDLYTLKYAGIGEFGDSGAPLFFLKNNRFFLLGIHYGGLDKGSDYPNLYEPAAKNLEFIENHTNINLLTHESGSGSSGGSGSGRLFPALQVWETVRCYFPGIIFITSETTEATKTIEPTPSPETIATTETMTDSHSRGISTSCLSLYILAMCILSAI